jgi:hypothetical protein
LGDFTALVAQVADKKLGLPSHRPPGDEEYVE